MLGCAALVKYGIIKLYSIGKSIKILDKVGARTRALEKLGAAQITHLKNLSSFKQLKTHIS
jgi:hypothetical protein